MLIFLNCKNKILKIQIKNKRKKRKFIYKTLTLNKFITKQNIYKKTKIKYINNY